MKNLLFVLIGLSIAGILSIKVPAPTIVQETNTTQRTLHANPK